MCPLITNVAQFTYQRPLGLSKSLAENVVPLIPHDCQQRCCVPSRLHFRAEQSRLGITQRSLGLFKPKLGVFCLQFTLNEWQETFLKKIQRLAYALVVRNCHWLLLG